jgi:hypothetical protein
MKKETILELVRCLRDELYGKKKLHYISDSWIIKSNTDYIPVYKRLSFGYKVDQNNNYELIIKIYSKNNRTRKVAKDILDKVIEGRIERVYSDKFEATFLLSKNKLQANNKYSLSLGSSVSNYRKNYGSIGAFVTNKNGEHLILTCAHVLKNKEQNIVYSPLPKRKIFSSHIEGRIGEIYHHYLPNKNLIPNYIDASTVLLDSEIDSHKNVILHSCKFEGRKIIPISDDFTVPEGTNVYKLGVNHLFKIGVYANKTDFHIKRHVFHSMHSISEKIGRFSLPGDSGSMVFIEQNDVLFGLGIIVGYEIQNGIRNTCVCPINRVLETFELSFL